MAVVVPAFFFVRAGVPGARQKCYQQLFNGGNMVRPNGIGFWWFFFSNISVRGIGRPDVKFPAVPTGGYGGLMG